MVLKIAICLGTSLCPSHCHYKTCGCECSLCWVLNDECDDLSADLNEAVPETELLDNSIQKGRAQLSVKTRRHRPSRSHFRDSISSTEGDESLERKVSEWQHPQPIKKKTTKCGRSSSQWWTQLLIYLCSNFLTMFLLLCLLTNSFCHSFFPPKHFKTHNFWLLLQKLLSYSSFTITCGIACAEALP